MIFDTTMWTAVLRCQSCKSEFSVHGVPSADVSFLPQKHACPACGFVPAGVPPGLFGAGHLIVRLEKRPYYRRRSDGDTWHFNFNCSEWPAVDLVERRDAPPADAELCNECRVRSGLDC
jgi:hypothetical protein